MVIFIPNIVGGDLNISAIIDILAPTRGEFLLYITCLIHTSHCIKNYHSLDSL